MCLNSPLMDHINSYDFDLRESLPFFVFYSVYAQNPCKLDYANVIRLSMSDYREQDWLTNIPLYAAIRVPSVIRVNTSSISGAENQQQ